MIKEGRKSSNRSSPRGGAFDGNTKKTDENELVIREMRGGGGGGKRHLERDCLVGKEKARWEREKKNEA